MRSPEQRDADAMPLIREALARFHLTEYKGKLHISVSHCVHCDHVVFGAMSDDCPNPECDGEIYPVSKWVPMGEAIDPKTLDQTS